MIIEYGEFDVSIDRDKYIGGSDIPAILGISKFKSRWQCLLEKAGLEEYTSVDTRYTKYGHDIEPIIRERINMIYGTEFIPCRVIDGDLRLHTDGFNGSRVLEIKSTSDVHATLDGYKTYLVQLVKYMEKCEVSEGILAVYNRPESMSLELDAERLQIFEIRLKEHKNLLNHINKELDKFRNDLERLKENPLLSEQDFLPSGSLVALSDKVVAFETQLAQMKEIEAQLKEAKKALYNEMLRRNLKSWTMPNGTKITMVAEVPAGTKMVNEFDMTSFKAEQPALYDIYMKQKEKATKGQSGYVRITIPK